MSQHVGARWPRYLLKLSPLKAPPTRWKAIPKEIHTQAGLAVVISIWEQRQKDSSGHDELVARLRSIDIFRPTKSGWKIVRTINYSEPN